MAPPAGAVAGALLMFWLGYLAGLGTVALLVTGLVTLLIYADRRTPPLSKHEVNRLREKAAAAISERRDWSRTWE